MAMEREEEQSSGLSPLLADFRILVLLFLGLRLTFAVVYQPSLVTIQDSSGKPVTVERGIAVFGDLPYYYQLVLLAQKGILPYRDYWFEFPPLTWGLYAGMYELASLGNGLSYPAWASLMGLAMTVCDLGVFYLLYRLGRRLYGMQTGMGLVWVYSLLAAPAIISWWTFEPVMALSVLLSVWWLLDKRLGASALAVVVGGLIKYVPLLLVPGVWRFLPARLAWRYTAVVALTLGVVGAGLWGWGGQMAYASLAAQFRKASYQTVWALFDGNWRTGLFVPPEQRTDPDTALTSADAPAKVPLGVRTALLVGPAIYVWVRIRRDDARSLLAGYSAIVVLFYLWAQGWSPQWLVVLTPLILLNFPHRLGVMVCLVLAFGAFLEYPGLFMHSGDTGGAIGEALRPFYALLILARTGLLIGIVAALGRQLGRETV